MSDLVALAAQALQTRGILLDLIAELRERQDRLRRKSAYPSELLQEYDFAMGDIADRAEARINAINTNEGVRLREVQGE